METLDNVAVADSYPAGQSGGAQLGPIYSSNGGYFSVTEPVYVQYAYGSYGSQFWTQEVPLPAGPVVLDPGTVGIRLRNYVAGTIAFVSGALSERGEPKVTVTSSGVAAPAAAATMITGRVTAGGAQTGTGFTVNHSATGTYVITFTAAFATDPTVVATAGPAANGNAIATINASSPTSVTILTVVTGSPTDQPFEFLATATV